MVMAAIKVPRLGLGRPRTRPEVVRADKVYSSRAIRQHLCARKIRRTIPEPPAGRIAARQRRGSRGGRPPSFDAADYRAPLSRRVRHRPAQRPSRHRHPLRQARRPLRGHRPHGGCQRLAHDPLRHGRRDRQGKELQGRTGWHGEGLQGAGASRTGLAGQSRQERGGRGGDAQGFRELGRGLAIPMGTEMRWKTLTLPESPKANVPGRLRSNGCSEGRVAFWYRPTVAVLGRATST